MKRTKNQGHRKSQRGFILVKSLIVIAGLVALIAVLAAYQRAALTDMHNAMRRRKAEASVQSGIARAVALLTTANANLVTLNSATTSDAWSQFGNGGLEEFNSGDNGDLHFRIQIVDAGSLINVNTAPAAQLMLLPMTQEMADCLLDWRETGQTPRSDGAKDGYYNGLTQPYNTKLGNLSTLDELLLIKNWTAYTLYQPQTTVTSSAPLPTDTNGNPLPLANLLTVDSGSPNTQASGTPRINLGVRGVTTAALTRAGISVAQTGLIIQGLPYTSFSTLLARPGLTQNTILRLLNLASFSAGTRNVGKINLDTASQAVLQTIPNVTPDIATSIVSRQSSGFTALGDLTTIPGVSGTVLRSIANAATVGSDTWIVRIYGESSSTNGNDSSNGTADSTGIAVEATVTLTAGKAQITSWNRLSAAGIPKWWNWQADTTTTVDAGTGS